MGTERSAEGVALLPPSHALVDRQQRVKELGALETWAPPPAAELQQLLGQVQALCTHCGADGDHLLAPLAREAGKLLQLHPHCAALGQCDEAAQAAARQAAEEATAALRSLRESLLVALGPAVEAAKVLAVQQRVAGGIQQPVAGGRGGRGGAQQDDPQQQRAATHQGTSYQSYLLYLREQRARLRAELPSATTKGADSCRAVERLAAQEWRLIEAPLKLEVTAPRRAALNLNLTTDLQSLPLPTDHWP